jgi:hypothetical protein
MEELISAILSALLEIFAEVLLQVVAEFGVAIAGRWFDNLFSESRPWGPAAAAVGYFILGLIFGLASLFLFPHPLVKPSRFHGISLLISPLITGLIMSQVGVWIRQREFRRTRIESFTYGATFAFGIALIRFIWLR